MIHSPAPNTDVGGRFVLFAMLKALFNAVSALSLVICVSLMLIRLDNSMTRDGFGGPINPYLHIGYHSFWLLEYEIRYFPAIGVSAILPLVWLTLWLTRPRPP